MPRGTEIRKDVARRREGSGFNGTSASRQGAYRACGVAGLIFVRTGRFVRFHLPDDSHVVERRPDRVDDSAHSRPVETGNRSRVIPAFLELRSELLLKFGLLHQLSLVRLDPFHEATPLHRSEATVQT